VDRFTRNQDHDDHQPILLVSSNTFCEEKCLVFVIICNQ